MKSQKLAPRKERKVRTLPPPEKRRPGIQCVSIDIEGILRHLTRREPWIQIQAPESADCTTFHYICQELDALAFIREGCLMIQVGGVMIYNNHFQYDKIIADYVYVSDSEEVEGLVRAA